MRLTFNIFNYSMYWFDVGWNIQHFAMFSVGGVVSNSFVCSLLLGGNDPI